MPKINTALFGNVALIPQVARIPFVETLSFLTDSFESYNGKESQIQLRSKPRQNFRYEAPISAANDAAAFNTAYGAIRLKWAVPAWGDAQFVGIVAAGAVVINCDVTNFDLRAASLAMLFDSCGKFQVIEITTLGAASINLSTPALKFRAAYLIPVRVGFVIGDILKPTNGFSGKVEINFQVDDLKAYDPAAPEQYSGNDIYYTPGLLESGSVAMSVTKRQDLIDYDLGPVARRSPWLISKVGRNHRTVMTTPPEVKAFRDFAYRRQGKNRPFWMPTFEHNLRVRNTGNIVSTLVMSADSYIDYASNRTHIAIQAAGVWYPRVISNPVPIDANTIQVTLSSPLNVPAKTVSRASYLALNRLDGDSFEINFNGAKAAECVVRMVEIQP